jgi:undecaprenyl-diphosphatase
VDERLMRRLSRRPRSRLDRSMALLSRAADRGLLWLGVAAVVAAAFPRSGPRAAGRGLLSLAVASALANGPLKLISGRRRPMERLSSPATRWVRPPATSSFPSGHAAAAFAFATGAALEAPALAIPLLALAGAVAYSRTHNRLHYPSDVAVGAAVGVAAAVATGSPARAAQARLRQALDRGRREGPPLQFRRAVLVASPHAGHAADGLRRAHAALQSSGIAIVEELHVDDVGRLRDLLARHGGEDLLVVAAGGDGTVGSVAHVLARTDAVLGVIPLGTSNDFARSLGIHANVDRAVALFTQGKVSTIDLGCMEPAEGRPMHFVHAATAGLNVSFAKLATQASFRRRLGRLTYAAAAVVALRDRRPFRCELVVDDDTEDLELTHLSVINAPVFGGFLGMRLRNSSVDDRRLDVLVVENSALRRAVARAALRALFRAPGEVSGIRSYRVRRLEVNTGEALDVALDGEVRGKLPATFVVVGEGLRVVTPQDFEDVDDPQP